MGGLAGHMSHLYDNPTLKFSQMKDIFVKAANGSLVGAEKTDGQNLFLSYSVKLQQARAARNKGNIKSGGMSARELADKFADRGNLTKAFVEAFDAWEKTISQIPYETQIDIFGPDANIYYNAEIQDPRNANVINYDNKNLVIHREGHAQFDKETGSVTDVDVSNNWKILNSYLLKNTVNPEAYNVIGKALVQLKKLDNDEILKTALSRLEHEIDKAGLSDNQQIADYIVVRLKKLLAKHKFSPVTTKEIIKKLLGTKGSTITSVLKTIPSEQVDVREAAKNVANDKSILGAAIAPIEDIVHDFSVEILKTLESAFIIDQKKEVQRLRSEVAQAIKAIESSGNERAMEILQKQMKKLKSLDNVSTAAEGFVFDYEGQTYKFTGNFAPINQILGLFKYGRAGIPAMTDLNEEGETAEQKVAIVPGGYKPPHLGHYMGANYFLEKVGVDKVIVLISPKSRFSSDDTVEITAEQSKQIWSIFTQHDDRYEILIAPSASPVKSTYDFMENLEPGTVLYLGSGEKDLTDDRFKGAQAWSDKNNLGVTVKHVSTPMNELSISATDLRDAVSGNNKKLFLNAMPKHLNKKQLQQIWNIVSGNAVREDNFLSLEGLESILDEISAMSAGVVVGHNNEEENMSESSAGLSKFFYKAGEDEGDIYFGLSPEDKEQIKSYLEQPGYPILSRRQKLKFIERWKDRKIESMQPNFVAAGSMSGKRDDDKMIDREEFLQEMQLRKLIRKAIILREQKKLNESRKKFLETRKLRKLIKSIIRESASEDVPHESTGINVLEELLKKIIPILETDYKTLTSETQQRKSFRSHIIRAVQNTLAPSQAYDDVSVNSKGVSSNSDIGIENPMSEQDVDIDIADDSVENNDKFIDIDGNGVPDSEEKDSFSAIPGEDVTGRNVALQCFEKIEKNIIDSYSILSDEKDRTLFYDYLITNLKLYFDKFEDELRTNIAEPDSSIYDQEKQKINTTVGDENPGLENPDTGEDELDLSA